MVTETIECKCGIFVCGKSKQNAESNLKQHIKSPKHKNQIRLKEENKG